MEVPGVVLVISRVTHLPAPWEGPEGKRHGREYE